MLPEEVKLRWLNRYVTKTRCPLNCKYCCWLCPKLEDCLENYSINKFKCERGSFCLLVLLEYKREEL